MRYSHAISSVSEQVQKDVQNTGDLFSAFSTSRTLFCCMMMPVVFACLNKAFSLTIPQTKESCLRGILGKEKIQSQFTDFGVATGLFWVFLGEHPKRVWNSI